MLSSNQVTKKLAPLQPTNAPMHPLKEQGYSIQIAKSIETVQALWSQLAPKDNLFLQYTYLSLLEQFPPDKMQFRYLIFYKNGQPIGISYQQIYHLNVEESLQQKEEEPVPSYCIIKLLTNSIKKWLIKRADFNLLVCGNLLLTGEYGFHFQGGINKSEAAKLVHDGMESLQQVLDKEQTKISIYFIKDYTLSEVAPIQATLEKELFHSFQMQPCMCMDVRPHWNSFEDYLADMSSKYRVRAKRARKKGKAIIKKTLSLEEIQENEARLYELYQQVAEGAGFNAFLLHPQYFTALKRFLGDQYKLTAYYIDDQLVAFYTSIFNGSIMDAHFLGVDTDYNRAHQVYLNILYDLVNTAIEHGSQHIDFARTALEIKSSVGAVAKDMLCFLKHRNNLSSKLLPVVFDSLNPEEEWQPRSPFKDPSPQS